ncbi:uncharacterized protein ATNIH1004_008784 [Aspergillus tanneri]|uniref:Protein phosphatase 4 core regulatory subunit R2 n=1 Tax=Aspergillus tanneri TaxID=1220188 RepID=A0A5M9MJI9_9EURO|nr:uncharacterized protein ATNIH1004_008784 [Aspergillus tanneri]KAA8644579.1 hypothetical protein ATNIH1004_008784 [Aspergillus tanneri]
MSLDEDALETAANGGWMDAYVPLPSCPSLRFLTSYPNRLQCLCHARTSPRFPPVSLGANKDVPDSQPQPSTLPAPLQLLLDSIRSNLRSLFSSKPPHTIQRLAELILHPNAHYRTLPAYLRAVDRTISVTSGADVFPLQMQEATSQPNGVVNGTDNTFLLSDHALGSDESLGGALLTPIPWLSNAASPGAEDGAVETEGYESASAAPQADQQSPQQESEPSTDTSSQQPNLPSQSEPVAVENQATEGAGSPPAEFSEDIPHARGPRLLGVADLGLQDGKGIEMTLLDTEQQSSTQPDEQQQQQQQPSQPTLGNDSDQTAAQRNADGDGDIVLEDAQRAKEEEEETPRVDG